MEINSEVLLKILPPLLSSIISIIGLTSGWIYTRDKLFTSRKNVSEFAYNLYKSTDNPIFKKLAYEYGISAITKDKNLNNSQREILLQSNDPVNDINNYSKCQKLISIANERQIFCWTKKRYRYWLYRKLIYILSLAFYFIGASIISTPFIYEAVVSRNIIEKIHKLAQLQKFGIASYLVACGLCIALISLHKLSIIHLAEKTMKSNRRN